MTVSLVSSNNMPWTGWFNRDLIENMPVGVYVCDADGVLVAYNKKAAILWGRTPVLGDTQQRFCGAHRLHLSDGTYVPHDQTPLALVLKTQQPYAFEAMVGRPDGVLRNVSANVAPLFNDEGVFVGFVNCVLDITDSKRATESRDRMWNLSQDIMLIAAHGGVITAVNPASEALLGWHAMEMVGSAVDQYIHPDERAAFCEKLQALAGGRKVETFETRCAAKDHSYLWLSWNMTSDGAYIHAVARNVTAEKEQAQALRAAEDALRQSQKMEAIGLLTGGVAHDFNNLLTVIRGSVDLLKIPTLSEERRARFIAAISDTADRGAKLTNQLLAFARRQTLQMQVFNVGDNVRAIHDMLGTLSGSRIAIAFRIADTATLVSTDASQLDTAIVNMVVNARDAMAGSGTITIAIAAASEIPAIRSHAARAGDFVTIAVGDTGSGISAENLERVFEPFFTTKSIGQGTGLGLSQVFGFTKQSGGEVLVESEVGVGTTFTLYLPRHLGAQAVADAAQGRGAFNEGGGKRVLIVEDNPQVGEFANATLEELGFDTVLVTSAADALVELHNGASRYDIVFSDVEMPGMNGIAMAREIRRLHPQLPIVLTSGYSHALANDGSDGFELLQKPYSIERLTEMLKRHLQATALH